MCQTEDLLDAARLIFHQSLAACRVEEAFERKVAGLAQDKPYAFRLRGGSDEPVAEVDLAGVEHLLVVAAGKGAASMLGSLLDRVRVPADCRVSGILIAPARPDVLPPGIEFFRGGHPLPTIESFRGAEAVLRAIEGATARTFCFFLLSGGASAMMELPLDKGISLEDSILFHQALVHSGASIGEINCVRKHFSAVKGGRLGLAAAAIPNLTVLVSDVPAGLLDALASGPTLPDSSCVADCRAVLDRFELWDKFPPSVRHFLESATLPETPKPGSFLPEVVTLLSDKDLAEAARAQAEALGFFALVDNTCDDSDYREAAQFLLKRVRELRRHHRRVCLVSTGEVTVRVSRPAGATSSSVGGRNQHFALYLATLLQAGDGPLAVLSAGSDGIDGNSSHAGALIHANLLETAAQRGGARDALARFDSATFLNSLGAAIKTGPTGNNLRDLRLLLSGS